MSEQDNVQRAQDGYAAFLRGDMPAVVEAMADDIEWVDPGPSDVPWAGTCRGKQAVQNWFGTLAQHVDFQVFEPREFIAQGDKVVVLVHVEGTARRNGRTFVNPEAHVWTFRDGKIARFQNYQDTAVVAAAFRGE